MEQSAQEGQGEGPRGSAPEFRVQGGPAEGRGGGDQRDLRPGAGREPKSRRGNGETWKLGGVTKLEGDTM